MSVCVGFDSKGYLVYTSNSIDNCNHYVLMTKSDYVLAAQTYDITPAEIAASFTWGFGTFIFFWWLGYVIKNARSVIKKA